jgi:hypothetical protein
MGNRPIGSCGCPMSCNPNKTTCNMNMGRIRLCVQNKAKFIFL